MHTVGFILFINNKYIRLLVSNEDHFLYCTYIRVVVDLFNTGTFDQFCMWIYKMCNHLYSNIYITIYILTLLLCLFMMEYNQFYWQKFSQKYPFNKYKYNNNQIRNINWKEKRQIKITICDLFAYVLYIDRTESYSFKKCVQTIIKWNNFP